METHLQGMFYDVKWLASVINLRFVAYLKSFKAVQNLIFYF